MSLCKHELFPGTKCPRCGVYQLPRSVKVEVKTMGCEFEGIDPAKIEIHEGHTCQWVDWSLHDHREKIKDLESRLAEKEKVIERYRKALIEISSLDRTENLGNPTWASRMAISALQEDHDYHTSLKNSSVLCPDCEAPCVVGKRMDGTFTLQHPIYACPKQIQEELDSERRKGGK